MDTTDDSFSKGLAKKKKKIDWNPLTQTAKSFWEKNASLINFLTIGGLEKNQNSFVQENEERKIQSSLKKIRFIIKHVSEENVIYFKLFKLSIYGPH